MKLGSIVHNYRIENNLTMEDFANKCGITKSYVSLIENDKNPRYKDKSLEVSISCLKRLADGMDMDVVDLFVAVYSKNQQLDENKNNINFIERTFTNIEFTTVELNEITNYANYLKSIRKSQTL